MAENGSDIARTPGSPAEHTSTRRVHTYSRLTTALAVLALATAGYALWRLDATRDRLDAVSDVARALKAEHAVLRAQDKALAARERQARRDVEQRLDLLAEAPAQLQELAGAVEELRGRAEGPERAWSRAEALFLLELAQRRLTLERDLDTAIVALEAADARLASLRDASFAGVRQQIARDLQALRAVAPPDAAGILARLASAEEQAMQAAVDGIVAPERAAPPRDALPEGVVARAWAIARRSLAKLVVVRPADDRKRSVVTAEEVLLHRQHLQLLLFSARTAVARHDASEYRGALASARRRLAESFDLTDARTQALLEEVQALEPIDIDPPLPEISASMESLRRLTPAARGPA